MSNNYNTIVRTDATITKCFTTPKKVTITIRGNATGNEMTFETYNAERIKNLHDTDIKGKMGKTGKVVLKESKTTGKVFFYDFFVA